MIRDFHEDWVYWLVLTTWMPWAIFVAYHWVTAPRWWRTSIGRGVMSPAVAVTILLTFAVINRMFDLPAGVSAAIRVLMFTSVITAGWLLLFAKVAEQRRARDGRCPQRRAEDRSHT